MKFKRLLKLLLDGATENAEPIFSRTSLREACPKAFALLKTKKVLQQVAAPENIVLRGHHGTVRQVKGKWFWVSLEDSGAEWVEISSELLETYKLSHRRFLAWLAECYGTSKEVNTDGMVWSLGAVIIQGQRCQVLYYPGSASKAMFMEAVRELESVTTDIPRLLLIPARVRFSASERSRWQGRGLLVEYLYGLATDEGVNLQSALPSTATSGNKPSYCFRRVKVGGSWEVGFNTCELTPITDTVAMSRIWLLLRNPGKKFTPAEMTDELAGLSADRAVNGHKTQSRATQRSAGTRARNISDLTTTSKNEGRRILREVVSAREEHGEESQEFKNADEAWNNFQRVHGIADTYHGRAKKEGDDASKEAETIKKSINRWIDDHRVTGLRTLAEHLHKYISRGTMFSYEPETELPWQT